MKKALALKRVATVLLFGVAFQLGNSVLAKLVAIEVDISAFKAQVASSGKPRFYLTRTTQTRPGQDRPRQRTRERRCLSLRKEQG